MTRTLTAALIVWIAAAPASAAQDRPRYAGRPLTDVLRDLQQGGLNITFSSELVRPEMRVLAEPPAGSSRAVLDAILKPHGLETRNGPRGMLLVVRGRRTPSRAIADRLPTGRVRGRVVDAASGIGLDGASVMAEDSGVATSTDGDGVFAFEALPAGRQRLFVSLVGYAIGRPEIDVRAGDTTNVTLPLSGGTGTYTEQLTVTADAFRDAAMLLPSVQTMTSAELQALRGLLTDDPFRALQTLPGVATGNDLRSEFSVRGSDFRHMGLAIDGVPTTWLVHNVRHYEDNGSIALINGDLIESAALAQGAQPQDHPGRTGAWLDIGLRDGSRAARQVHAAVSMASASLIAEGPLGASRRGSWIAAVRQSYLQWLLRRLNTDRTAFSFTDAEAKLAFDVSPAQSLEAGVVAGRSQLDQDAVVQGPNVLGVGTSAAAVAWVGWRSVIGPATTFTQRLGVAGHRFDNVHESGRTQASGSRSDLSYSGAVLWQARPTFLIRAGLLAERQADHEIAAYLPGKTTTAPLGGHPERVDGSGWTSSGDARAVWSRPSGTSIEAGVRVSHSALTGQTVPAPWILGAQPLGRSLTLRAGISLSPQLPDFDQVVGTFGTLEARAERARHVDVAIEGRPASDTRWQLTFYDRREDRLLRLEDSETRRVNGEIAFASEMTPFWLNALDGGSHGVELLVQRRATNGLGGWIGYAYQQTRYTDVTRQETFRGDYDQRHALNVFAEERLSTRTRVSAKLRLGTGFPVPGYFEERGGLLFAGASRNTIRLPFYARLDLRADHAFNHQRWRLTLFAEVVNVLNRTNYAATSGGFALSGRAEDFTSSQFPILPSAGIRIDF